MNRISFSSQRIDLTGLVGEELAGFGKRDGVGERYGVDDLEVSILWIQDVRKKNCVLIGIDALYLNGDYLSEIYEMLALRYSVSRSEVIFNASHTHSAPNVSTPNFGQISKVFVSRLISAIKMALGSAFARLDAGYIRFYSESLPEGLIVNRRKFSRDLRSLFLRFSMTMTPNYERDFDSSIRVLKLSNKDLNAVLINFSCHPVFNSNMQISSDFPGVLRRKLNEDLDGTIFVQGFCGDVRPNSVVTRFRSASFIPYIKALANGLAFKKPSLSFFNMFNEKIADNVKFQLSKKGVPVSGLIEAMERQAELRSRTGKSSKKVVIKLVRVETVLFISIAGEVNSRYFYELSRKFPKLNIVPLGYSEDVVGYIPFPSEVDEGGYEVTSFSNYGWDSEISKDSLKGMFDLIIESVHSIAETNQGGGDVQS